MYATSNAVSSYVPAQQCGAHTTDCYSVLLNGMRSHLGRHDNDRVWRVNMM